MVIGRSLVRIVQTRAFCALLALVASIGAAAALDHLPTEIDPTAVAFDDALAVIADNILKDLEASDGSICLGRRDIRAPADEVSILPLPAPVVAALRNQTYKRQVTFKPRCRDYKVTLELATLVQVGTPACEALHCADKCAHDECKSAYEDPIGGTTQHQQEYVTKVLVRPSGFEWGTVVFRVVTADGRLKQVLRDPDEIWGGY